MIGDHLCHLLLSVDWVVAFVQDWVTNYNHCQVEHWDHPAVGVVVVAVDHLEEVEDLVDRDNPEAQVLPADTAGMAIEHYSLVVVHSCLVVHY